MSAKVRPEKLNEALNAKLSAAAESLYKLREADKPKFTRDWDAGRMVVDFLFAARGVYPIAETFANSKLQRGDFEDWRDRWEKTRLTTREESLWRQMEKGRNSQEHGDGADLVAISIPVPEGDYAPRTYNVAHLGLAASPFKSQRSKGGVEYRAYLNKRASEVCAEYLELARRFADDFLSDHAYLITSRG